MGICSVYGQTKIWTLEECINYAISHNLSIQQLEIQKSSAEIDLNTSRMSRLPDLNAGIGQNWNFGRTQISSGLYENQTQSNTSLSIGTSIPIFSGFRISNEIAKNRLELLAAVQNLEKAKESLALNVGSLFLQALFNKEIVKINEDQLSLSQMQVERTKVLVEQGKVPVSQLYDIEAQVANDQLVLVQAKNSLKLSLLDLAQNLELEQTANFDIHAEAGEDLIEEYMRNISTPEDIFNYAVQNKSIIKEQEYRLKSAEKMVKIVRAGYYPSLSLGLGFGTNYFYLYRSGLINNSFSDQIRNNAGEYINLNLNIPIFNRLSTRNQLRSAKLNIENQQLVLNNTKKTLYKEIETAYLNAVSAHEKYHASQLAVKATSEAFQYAKERYETGKSSVYEFNEAKAKLVKSQSEEVQAKFDYIFRMKVLDFYRGMPIKL
jgi:outer membrane protein